MADPSRVAALRFPLPESYHNLPATQYLWRHGREQYASTVVPTTDYLGQKVLGLA